MGTLAICQIRSFNRTVTECIGALDDQFLGRTLSLGEARLLWEIEPGGSEIRVLRGRLGLDSGYVSRTLRSLEQKGLILLATSPEDRRVRRVHRTKEGTSERVELDRRSDTLAQRILEPLSERQRETLVAAAKEVERLLQASMVSFAIEDPTSPDARWCFDRYFDELNTRFEAGFNPALSISAEARELTPPSGMLLIARLRDEPVGCAALKLHIDSPAAELKRMWVASSARGIGVGSRILREIERHARQAGVNIIRLETNRTLSEAIALYRRSGYLEVEAFNAEPYAHHWFEKSLP